MSWRSFGELKVPLAVMAWALFSSACGARSGLGIPEDEQNGGASASGGSTARGGGPSSGGSSAGGGGEAPQPCVEGQTEPCGSDVGECTLGERRCENGFFGPCEGGVLPTDELCNGLDEDCDGVSDNGFGLGGACDGPDSDACLDDVMTCQGCSAGPDILEVCNGLDDNCNGEIDSDCEVGGCAPTLLVTGSTPSSPGCVDFPVEAGSTGSISYPCAGGMVSATLGAVTFSGTVQGGFLVLDGVALFNGPDGCQWETDHHIEGFLPGGQLAYSYSEHVVVSDGNCWQPCTEVGDVEVQW